MSTMRTGSAVPSDTSWGSSFKAQSDASQSSTTRRREIEMRVFEDQILELMATREATDMQLQGLLDSWKKNFGAEYPARKGGAGK
jgi:hypothetical protein